MVTWVFPCQVDHSREPFAHCWRSSLRSRPVRTRRIFPRAARPARAPGSRDATAGGTARLVGLSSRHHDGRSDHAPAFLPRLYWLLRQSVRTRASKKVLAVPVLCNLLTRQVVI